ncbi:uncharacterized protein LOC126413260 [Schistocerca serialis cubense]|uniref:uncharacterized protein LOC126413260 n=1 Tax=Schistocerca serialis cubense TaxID=2023355 RepID=UPI00214F1AC7|nr:uncharacterized protein LOC126413260 [Schistocerca serialis cubense]
MSNSQETLYKCEECSSEFKMRKNFYAHMRKVHELDIHVSKKGKGSELCPQCGIAFMRCSSLKRHQITVHGMKSEENSRKCRIICPQCSLSFLTYDTLRTHIQENHDVSFECQEIEFGCLVDFEEWKISYEKVNHVRYVMNCSEQERLEKRVRYYHCHRSFNFNSKGTGARCVKSMGTNKIGSTCPSNMQVTITEDKCCLKFFPKQMGHTQDVGRTFLHGNERAELARRLSQGVPVGRVLQDVRSAPIAASVERIHLLEKKDLHNIKRDFDIGYATKKHENDAVSVKLWVEEMKRQSDNPESEQCSLPSSADNEYVSALLSGNSEKSADTFEQDVMSHCETIVALSKGTQCGQETKAKVLKDLKKIIGNLNKDFSFSEENTVNVNAKIESQARFFSTKQRRIL